jgi:hypothetical protein
MDRETIITVWLNCLLVKEGVRPGYITETTFNEFLKKFFEDKIAKQYFNLKTFLWGNNLLITKDELTDDVKEKITQGYEWAKLRDPRENEYHTILGNILGYDCVDSFSMVDFLKSVRVSFSFNATLVNGKKIQLFPYVCPAVYIDGELTYTPENLDIALRYLNRIRSVFRENYYSKFIIEKVSLEISYLYPFSSTLVSRDQLVAKGLPMPPLKKSGEVSSETPSASTSELLTAPLAPSPMPPAEPALSSGGKRKKARRTRTRHHKRIRTRKHNARKF